MGNTTDNDLNYVKLVDEIDEYLVKAFYESHLDKATDDPLRCYLMLKILLNKIGGYSPGMQIENVKEQLENFIGEPKIAEVDELAGKIAVNFKAIVEPTYLAASYWSPIDDRRHTALYRQKRPNEEEEKKVLAYACAFFALTFFGAGKGYYSATQFTAVHANRQRGVRVSYEEDCDRESWWCIPKEDHQKILDDTGITTAIENYLLKDDVSIENLKEGLRPLLSNRDADPDTNLKPFAEYFINDFSNTKSSISRKTLNYAEQAKQYVNNLFDADLDIEKSLFMLMTNLIYDVAFPSNYFCAFPVRIRNRCSIVTVGTAELLRSNQYLALDRIATSIFMQPLLLDYASQVANEERESFQLNLAQAAAHTFKNLTKDIPVIGNKLLVEFNDISEIALNTLDDGQEIITKISGVKEEVARLSAISSFITAISLAQHRLARLTDNITFIDDPDCEIFRAVTLVAIDMWKAAREDWEIEEYDLEECFSIIENTYGERDLEKLALNIDFALLLFLINEPLINIRPESFGEKVKIKLEVRGQSLFLCQQTFETEKPGDSIQSDSIKDINKIIEKIERLSEQFIRIDENVRTVDCDWQGDVGRYNVNRETEIEILKIPMLGSNKQKR